MKHPFGICSRNICREGKIDVFITYEDYSESTVAVKYNKEIAAEYMQYLNQMAEDFGLENDIKVSGLSRYPEVFTMEEIAADEEEIWKLLEETIRGAAEQFVQSRGCGRRKICEMI